MAKKRSNRGLWIVLIAIVVIGGGIFLYLQSQKDDRAKVLVSEIEKRTIIQTVNAIGNIQPETEVKVSSQASGEIIYLGVKEGDTVKMNQLLVKIKPDIIEAQLEQMRASADASKMEIKVREAEKNRAEADLERMTKLYQQEFVSKQEFDAAKSAYESAVSGYKGSLARYESALASLRQVERNKERTSIFSPIEGVVTALNVEVGEKVVGTEMMQGTEMMRVADLSVINAVVDVDENDIVHVEKNDTAWVEIDAIPDKQFKGFVYEIGHSAQSSSLGTQEQVTNFSVKIRLLDMDSKMRPGMSCNVDIETEIRKDIITAPLQAVTVRIKEKEEKSENGMVDLTDRAVKEVKRPPSVVFINENGKAKMVEVKTGISDKGFIEIQDGLKEGDSIISGPFSAVSRTLKDGDEVRIDSALNMKFKRNR
jgi:HlyD family secretion protein